MPWSSFGEMLHLGGYGLYVWPSFGITLLCMVWEVVALRVRRMAALREITQTADEGAATS